MAQDDREALRSIFRATNGPDGWFNTEGWNTNAELGDWFGVQVNASKSRVVGLHLGDTYHRRVIYYRDGERDAVARLWPLVHRINSTKKPTTLLDIVVDDVSVRDCRRYIPPEL